MKNNQFEFHYCNSIYCFYIYKKRRHPYLNKNKIKKKVILNFEENLQINEY